MRKAFTRALYDISKKNKDVYSMTADIGVFAFNDIKKDFPERFFNVGVAEANMMGMAAGLALSDKIPFVFTIAPFITMRCCEQIKVDVCYHDLPVKIYGAGGGFVYGPQGATHHAIEEIGVLRSLPNITLVCPSDPIETEKLTYESMKLKGPLYVRISRNNEPNYHDKEYDFKFGVADEIKSGSDISIISTGPVLGNVLDSYDVLKSKGYDISIINMATVKPIDKKAVLKCAKQTGNIITVEEHNIIGGLGSAVAEVLSENNCSDVNFKRLGVNDKFCEVHGTHEELQHEYGISSDSIITEVDNLLSGKIISKV